MNRDTSQAVLLAVMDDRGHTFEDYLLDADEKFWSGNIEAAREKLSIVLDPNKEFVGSLDLLIEANMLMGKTYLTNHSEVDYSAAEEFFLTAWELSRDCPNYDLRVDAINHYCGCLEEQEKYDEAIKILKRELDTEYLSNSPALLSQLAGIYLSQYDTNAEEDAFDLLANISLNDFVAYGQLHMDEPLMYSPFEVLLSIDPLELKISYQDKYITLIRRLLREIYSEDMPLSTYQLLTQLGESLCIMNKGEEALHSFASALDCNDIRMDPSVQLKAYTGLAVAKSLTNKSTVEIQNCIERAEEILSISSDIPPPIYPRSYLRSLREKCEQNLDFPPDKLEGALSKVLEFAVR